MTVTIDTAELTADPELLTLTPMAVSKAAALLAETGTPELALRVAVRPGGCSGFQYDGNADVKVADFEEVLV